MQNQRKQLFGGKIIRGGVEAGEGNGAQEPVLVVVAGVYEDDQEADD